MIDGVKVRPLKPIHDERGYLMEMLRSDWPELAKFGQVYITIAYPDVRSSDSVTSLEPRPRKTSRPTSMWPHEPR